VNTPERSMNRFGNVPAGSSGAVVVVGDVTTTVSAAKTDPAPNNRVSSAAPMLKVPASRGVIILFTFQRTRAFERYLASAVPIRRPVAICAEFVALPATLDRARPMARPAGSPHSSISGYLADAPLQLRMRPVEP
jgi:hypothetical protein